MESELPPVDFDTRDTSAFTRAIMDEYFPLLPGRGGDRGNTATPRHVQPLLAFLRTVMTAAERAHARTGVAFRDPQWLRDYGAMSKRLEAYEQKTAQAIADGNGDDFPQPWGTEVMLPLLLGWFPGARQQQPLDAATPISLQHQAEVSRATMNHAWNQLGRELSDRGQAIAGPLGAIGAVLSGQPIRWGSVLRWTAIVGAGVGVGLGVRALIVRGAR